MSFNIGDNFKYYGRKFLDSRQQFKTLEEMNNCFMVPNGFITFCNEDNKRYEFIDGQWIELILGTTEEEKERLSNKIDRLETNEYEENGIRMLDISFYAEDNLIRTITVTDRDDIGMTDEERRILNGKVDDVELKTVENDDNTVTTTIKFIANNSVIKTVEFTNTSQGMTDEERESLNKKFDNIELVDNVLTLYSNDEVMKTIELPENNGMTDEERESLNQKFDDVIVGKIIDEEENELTKLDFMSNGEVVKSIQFAGGGGSTKGGELSTSLPETSTMAEKDNLVIPYTFTSPNYGDATLFINIINGESTKDLEYPVKRQGTNSVNLGAMLKGINYISMFVVDAMSKMTNIVSFTVVCGALELTSTFDDGMDYASYSAISIPFTVSALDKNETMTLHVNIDGQEFTQQAFEGYGSYTFPTEFKVVGVHRITLQVITDLFQSNMLEYNIVIADNKTVLISTKDTSMELEEGYNIEIPYRVSTTKVATYIAEYYLDGELYSSENVLIGNNKFIASYRDFPLGLHDLIITVRAEDNSISNSLPIGINIIPSTFKRIEHVTAGLEVYFDMNTGSNNSDTRDTLRSLVPTSTGNYAELKLHDYNYATNGWLNGRLVNNGKAWAEIVNYLPLATNVIDGFTFDILFKNYNSGDNDARVIDCTGEDTPFMGFFIDSEKAIATTESNQLKTYYTDRTDMRVTFVVNRTSTYYEEWIKDENGMVIPNPNPTYKPNPMIQTYIDGIFTDVAMLSDSGEGNNKIYENFLNNERVLINTDKDKLVFGNNEIKSIRIYNRPLSYEEVLQNYMADYDDLMEQKTIYDKNYVTVDSDIPTLNFYDTEIGKCDLMTKDNKQYINVVYTSPNKEIYGESFDLIGRCAWQGTSSLAYPVKNYKFTLYDFARDENGDIIEETKWDTDTYSKHKIDMYPSAGNGHKEHTYCIKVDYMDSSHCRNTGTARLVNDFLFDGAPNPAKQIDPKTRDTINGHPCQLYINGKWIGLCNFNHDKSCTKSLGLETIPDTVRWEIKANSDSSAGAFVKTWTNVEECYNAINTDFEIVFDEDAFEEKTGEYDVTRYYDELGFEHEEEVVMGTYYDYAILSLARFVNFVSEADEETFKARSDEYFNKVQACRYYLNVMTMGMIDNFADWFWRL